MLLATVDEFGFALKLDKGADVQTVGSPSASQGALTFAYGDVNTILTWIPKGDSTELALVNTTYDLIQSSKPNLTFETISADEITVDGELGVFLGFKTVDASGNASGGLIGSWTCQVSETSLTLTLTGDDPTLVQLRFDRLLDNFACAS